MQVEQKVPVTRVARVSEMRTVGSIADDALILVVQNGTGSKTTFGQLKRQILVEAKDTAEGCAAEAATLVANKSAAIASDLESLSGSIFKKEVPALQRNVNAVDGKLHRLSIDLAKNVREAYDFGKETREMLVQCNIQDMKQKDRELEDLINQASSTLDSGQKQLGQQIETIKGMHQQDVSQIRERMKLQLDHAVSEAKAMDEKQDAKICSVQQNVSVLSSAFTDKSEQLAALKHAADSSRAWIEESQKSIRKLVDNQQSMQQHISEVSALAQQTAELSSVKSELDNFDAKLFGLKVKSILTDGTEVVDSINDGEIDKIYSKLNSLEEQLAALSSQLESK